MLLPSSTSTMTPLSLLAKTKMCSGHVAPCVRGTPPLVLWCRSVLLAHQSGFYLYKQTDSQKGVLTVLTISGCGGVRWHSSNSTQHAPTLYIGAVSTAQSGWTLLLLFTPHIYPAVRCSVSVSSSSAVAGWCKRLESE